MIISKSNRTKKLADEISELRVISGHMLGATRVQIPENNLDHLFSITTVDNALETNGSGVLSDTDKILSELLTGL